MHILNKIILALIILSFNGALQARTIKKVEVSIISLLPRGRPTWICW